MSEHDTPIDGRAIAAGFDPNRNRHLAFGAGAHACAGMSVARLEARIAILKAIQRLPGLHLTAVPMRDARARFRGFRSVPAAI
jgi:cytochrome P450